MEGEGRGSPSLADVGVCWPPWSDTEGRSLPASAELGVWCDEVDGVGTWGTSRVPKTYLQRERMVRRRETWSAATEEAKSGRRSKPSALVVKAGVGNDQQPVGRRTSSHRSSEPDGWTRPRCNRLFGADVQRDAGAVEGDRGPPLRLRHRALWRAAGNHGAAETAGVSLRSRLLRKATRRKTSVTGGRFGQ